MLPFMSPLCNVTIYVILKTTLYVTLWKTTFNTTLYVTLIGDHPYGRPPLIPPFMSDHHLHHPYGRPPLMSPLSKTILYLPLM